MLQKGVTLLCMNQLDLGNSMHKSKQSNWAHLPGDIGRRIRFKQMQQRLQTALDFVPKTTIIFEREVSVEFMIESLEDDDLEPRRCVLSDD